MSRLILVLALASTFAALTACGGDSGDSTTTSPTARPAAAAGHQVTPAAHRRSTFRPKAGPLIAPPPSPSGAENASQTFDDASTAQAQCPSDTVVWVNSNSGIYHMPGERWYGNTENGFYMCQRAANAAGYRETENGQ